jgi:hypothetical protein
MPKTALQFLTNEAGEAEGLGHAGIETYRDSPYTSLGREHGQNSHDAAAKLPVTVSFDVFSIATDEFPALDEQREAVEACLSEAKDAKAKGFFKNAQELLNSETLTIMRVSDFNTVGLKGPSEAGKPFHALLKGSGVSTEKKDTSGGSFGIGKNAAYAVSDLQTVFYSTVYLDDDEKQHFLAQGKTILTSHTDSSGALKRASGYWGYPGYSPVDDPSAVPEWLRRTDIGTSVFVIGFRDSEDWQFRIAGSLIQNFFGAIHDDKLRFTLNNSYRQTDHCWSLRRSFDQTRRGGRFKSGRS